MENITTSIIERLQANAGKLGLSYIDEDYGQVEIIDDDTRDTYPVTFPAALVSIDSADWSNVTVLRQEGMATITVNLYLDCYDDTHAYSTTISKVEERISLLRKVTELLHGWRPVSGCGALIRTASRMSTGNHGIKVYSVTYTMAVYESFDPTATATIKEVSITT
jgi:hypothetical protein